MATTPKTGLQNPDGVAVMSAILNDETSPSPLLSVQLSPPRSRQMKAFVLSALSSTSTRRSRTSF